MPPAIRCGRASLVRRSEMVGTHNTDILMRRFIAAAATAALTISMAPAAHAAEWMLIAGDGIKPDRNVHYLAIDLISTTTDLSDYDPKEAIKDGKGLEYIQDRQIQNAWVVQVLENPKDPDTIFYTVNVKCRQKLVQIKKAFAVYRDATPETITSDEWMPVPDNWLSRVYTAACDTDNVVKAIKAVVDSKAYDNLEKLKPLLDLGMIYAGKWSTLNYVKLSDFTWDKLWQSGTRPDYTTNKTPEQLQQQADALNAQIAQLGGKATELEGTIGNLDAESEFIAATNKTFKAKNRQQQKIFFNMEGWTEQEIVDFWGVPNSARDYAGTRALEYYAENDTRQTYIQQIAIQDSKGNVTGMREEAQQTGELSACAMTLSLKPGGSKPGYRLVDYNIRSTNCKASTLGQLVR